MNGGKALKTVGSIKKVKNGFNRGQTKIKIYEMPKNNFIFMNRNSVLSVHFLHRLNFLLIDIFKNLI